MSDLEPTGREAAGERSSPAARATTDDHLFGPVDPARACGECTACCTVLRIEDPALRKPENVPCVHLADHGCGVYATRPSTCRGWQCLWKRSDLLPLDARPDKLGVMFSFESRRPPRYVAEHAFFLARAVNSPADFESAALKQALNGLVAEHPLIPIWLSHGATKINVYPALPLQAVIEGQAQDPSLLPTALAWLEGYASLANPVAGETSWFRDPRWRERYTAPQTGPVTGSVR